MSPKAQRARANVTAVAAGAAIGGVTAWLFAPAFFWAFLLGGAMTAGALWVGFLLFATSENGSGGSR
jgi:hypothetical protein